MRFPRVIGHRGACGFAPENTLTSFRKAKDLGCTWVEFDVMLAACGEAIVIHDEKINRTTDGRGNVAELTFDEIKQFDAGSWFGKEFSGEHIPRFVDVIDCLAELNLHANVEIKPSKGKDVDTAEKIIEIIQNFWPKNLPQPLVSSFSAESMGKVFDSKLDVPLGVLFARWQKDWLARAKALNATTVHVKENLLTPQRVSEIKRENYFLLSYTVNYAERARELFG